MDLQKIYDEIIKSFEDEYTKKNELSMQILNKSEFKEETTSQGLFSKYYTLQEGEDFLQIHEYSYDRDRAFIIQPDGNRVTVTLQVSGQKLEKVYSWLDKR